ncbi:MAG: hypothetical protein V1897_03490 [Pseudomonadota bacterium]
MTRARVTLFLLAAALTPVFSACDSPTGPSNPNFTLVNEHPLDKVISIPSEVFHFVRDDTSEPVNATVQFLWTRTPPGGVVRGPEWTDPFYAMSCETRNNCFEYTVEYCRGSGFVVPSPILYLSENEGQYQKNWGNAVYEEGCRTFDVRVRGDKETGYGGVSPYPPIRPRWIEYKGTAVTWDEKGKQDKTPIHLSIPIGWDNWCLDNPCR